MKKNLSQNKRVIIVLAIFLCALFVFAARLVNMQLGQHQYYQELASQKTGTTKVISTARGEVYDRNGVKMISNEVTSNVILDRSSMINGINNSNLLKILKLLNELNYPVEDMLPVSLKKPYTLDVDYKSDENKYKLLTKFMKNHSLEQDDISDDKLYDYLYKRYDMEKTLQSENVVDGDIRLLCGFRYLLEANDFSSINPFVLLENASDQALAIIAEQKSSLPGLEIVPSYKRVYNLSTVASHILGSTGPIYAEETEKYKEKGYALNAIVGKDGAEGAFEEYLRSEDGAYSITYNTNGEIIDKVISKQPKQANCVRLTLDSNLQKVAEDALGNLAKNLKRDAGISGVTGCAVVMDPNTFEIFAIANYPTFDMNTYRQNYNQLAQDESIPLLNRCTFGIYPPGSTYKISTAACALSNGFITQNTYIEDKGIYKRFASYQPKCWVYSKTGATHGTVNVVEALKTSCNYFFYEVGYRMGIEVMTDFSKKLGLGEKTGIETGESSGILASPEEKAAHGKEWQPGDTIQAAIGQSDHAFTPIQLCSFLSTILNGGKRYKAHLLKSVDEFYTQNIVYEPQPELLSEVDITPEQLELIKYSMKTVVEDGTASSVFTNYKHSVAGKTGTAQTGNGFNTASFIGFAPYDNPEIAVAVVVEKGSSGGNAATVAKAIFDYYYEGNANQQ